MKPSYYPNTHGPINFCIILTNVLYLAEKVAGEVIHLHKVTRSEMGSYMCIANNGVPPAVSKTVQLNVNCKYDLTLLDQAVSFSG